MGTLSVARFPAITLAETPGKRRGRRVIVGPRPADFRESDEQSRVEAHLQPRTIARSGWPDLETRITSLASGRGSGANPVCSRRTIYHRFEHLVASERRAPVPRGPAPNAAP